MCWCVSVLMRTCILVWCIWMVNECISSVKYMCVMYVCVGLCVSPGATRPDKSPLTLSCLTAQTVFAQWINYSHAHTYTHKHSFSDLRDTSNTPLPNLTRNNLWVCACVYVCVRAKWSVYSHPAACWGRPTPYGPSPLHFNTVVTGAAPIDNGAPPELAASAT